MVPRLRVTVGEAFQMVLKRLIAFGDPLLVGVVHRDFLLEDEYEVIYMAVTEVDEYEGICELNDDGLAPSRFRTHQTVPACFIESRDSISVGQQPFCNASMLLSTTVARYSGSRRVRQLGR